MPAISSLGKNLMNFNTFMLYFQYYRMELMHADKVRYFIDLLLTYSCFRIHNFLDILVNNLELRHNILQDMYMRSVSSEIFFVKVLCAIAIIKLNR